jgi:GNAT superfamily N-acetyltransferase
MTVPGNHIRLAAHSDLERLAWLDDVASREASRKAKIRQAIETKACWVGEDGTALLGYVLLNRAFFGFELVDLLYVAPSVRRRGVGRALIEHVERECSTSKLFTSTNESNSAMRGLLARLGYRSSGVIHNLDADDPELIFVKHLSDRA